MPDGSLAFDFVAGPLDVLANVQGDRGPWSAVRPKQMAGPATVAAISSPVTGVFGSTGDDVVEANPPDPGGDVFLRAIRRT